MEWGFEDERANCSLTKHSRNGNKLAEQGNEMLEYSWFKNGQSLPAGKDKVKNLFNCLFDQNSEILFVG